MVGIDYDAVRLTIIEGGNGVYRVEGVSAALAGDCRGVRLTAFCDDFIDDLARCATEAGVIGAGCRVTQAVAQPCDGGTVVFLLLE